jgi:hypothetical protein
MDCDVSLIAAWLAGWVEIPPKAAAWIETLAVLHEKVELSRPLGLKGTHARGH